jgi:hypothetical protein
MSVSDRVPNDQGVDVMTRGRDLLRQIVVFWNECELLERKGRRGKSAPESRGLGVPVNPVSERPDAEPKSLSIEPDGDGYLWER